MVLAAEGTLFCIKSIIQPNLAGKYGRRSIRFGAWRGKVDCRGRDRDWV